MSERDAVVSEYVPADERLTFERWASALRDDHLLGQVCEDCGHVQGVPKAVCQACTSQSLSGTVLPEFGSVLSETTIEVTPEAAPDRYQVAIVDLGETRVLARVETGVEIGDDVTFAGSVEYEGLTGPYFE
jgi:uncharacterized OB-fold protein